MDTDYVFGDPYAITRDDTDHHEPRYVTLGRDALGAVLVVVWTLPYGSDKPRVISGKASRNERETYAQGMQP